METEKKCELCEERKALQTRYTLHICNVCYLLDNETIVIFIKKLQQKKLQNKYAGDGKNGTKNK